MGSAGMTRDPDGRGMTFTGSLSSLVRVGGGGGGGCSVNGDADVCEYFAAGSQMKSVETKSYEVDEATIELKQLYKFDAPDTKAVLTGADADWSTQSTWQKMAIRKRDAAGNAELQFASFNPVPAGDAENTALSWDDTKGAWIKAAPSEGTGGGTPTGYEEVTGTIYLKERIIYGTFLVKTAGKVVTNYTSTDARLLLQPVVHSSTVTLDLDKGYLKS